ncbi:hypothetical protein Plhal703r1_c26g0109231 [Plasmopara halstedii]
MRYHIKQVVGFAAVVLATNVIASVMPFPVRQSTGIEVEKLVNVQNRKGMGERKVDGEERASHVFDLFDKNMIYPLKRFIGYQPPASASKNRLGANGAKDAQWFEKMMPSYAQSLNSAKNRLDAKRTHSLEEKWQSTTNFPEINLDDAGTKLHKSLILMDTPRSMLSSLKTKVVWNMLWKRDIFEIVSSYIKACEDTASTRSADKWGVEAAYEVLRNSGRLPQFAKLLLEMEKQSSGPEKRSSDSIRIFTLILPFSASTMPFVLLGDCRMRLDSMSVTGVVAAV